ncbi:MAG: helix-turn-helix domain-containing protein [Planctomycetota bacterium]
MSRLILSSSLKHTFRLSTPELIPLDIRTAHLQNYNIHFKLGTSLKEVEKEMILTTLGYVNNNKTKAASILGIGTRTLYRKLEEYGIQS